MLGFLPGLLLFGFYSLLSSGASDVVDLFVSLLAKYALI